MFSRLVGKSRIVAEHRVGAPCELCASCHHSALHKIDQGHTQGYCQAIAGRSRRRAQRELYCSSRQGRLADIAEINRTSPAIFMLWGAMSRQTMSSRSTARHGRLSRSRATFNGTIQRTAYARAAGFDDSMRRTSIATSRNMIPCDKRDPPHFF